MKSGWLVLSKSTRVFRNLFNWHLINMRARCMAYVTEHNTDYDPVFSDYIALLKPRVMSLVVFTAFVGLMAAPISLHPVEAFLRCFVYCSWSWGLWGLKYVVGC